MVHENGYPFSFYHCLFWIIVQYLNNVIFSIELSWQEEKTMITLSSSSIRKSGNSFIGISFDISAIRNNQSKAASNNQLYFNEIFYLDIADDPKKAQSHNTFFLKYWI